MYQQKIKIHNSCKRKRKETHNQKSPKNFRAYMEKLINSKRLESGNFVNRTKTRGFRISNSYLKSKRDRELECSDIRESILNFTKEKSEDEGNLVPRFFVRRSKKKRSKNF